MVHSVHTHYLATLAVLPISFVVITALRRLIATGQHKPHRPPGPTPFPVLGNVLSIDAQEPWLTYAEWRAVYGDLVFVRILDQEVVVINCQKIAEDLLDKRSRIYSDRPYLATLEPFGFTHNFSLTGYNDEWRLCRRIFHQTFHPVAALKFRPLQIRRARQMIVNLIDDPRNYNSHFATSKPTFVKCCVTIDLSTDSRLPLRCQLCITTSPVLVMIL